MLFELTLVPVGGDSHISDELAAALQIIDSSGLPYQLNATATCVEGEWDEVMPLIRKCHDSLRQKCPHIITMIKIEDDQGETNKLSRNVAAVEQAVGHALSH